ncbi:MULTISPECIES: FHA domain-containing protein [Saccharopolyspora]|uniref:FHA domain-containing protein n=1 Tax=Saccharopolyspora cebuensis TaxID=418759 RepID=A0ABV4CGH4_9PSEU
MTQPGPGAVAPRGAARTEELSGPRQETRSAAAVPAPRAPAETTTAALVISRGDAAGTEFALTRDRTVVGRNRECDVVVDDPTVSRAHAAVVREDGNFVLVDGGSLNGTYLNRRPVDSAVLVDGDEIWIGKIRFTYRAP